MKVAIVYNEPVPDRADSVDVLDQMAMVTEALQELKYHFRTFPVGNSLSSCANLLNELRRYSPSVIFNLFEGLGDDARFHPVLPSLFEIGGFPYTGAPFAALFTTSDKILSKTVLKCSGLPTPRWDQYDGSIEQISSRAPWIIKPSLEDGSVGIDDESIIHDRDSLLSTLPEMYLRHNRQPILIEEYIDGRELNIPMLELKDGTVKVFPISEIIFDEWPADKPRIVNYAAKWDEGAFEYENTNRAFYPEGAPLEYLEELSLKCWRIFRLRGYARVDARMDSQGNIFIIEINANPCIADGSGFMRSMYEGGLEAKDVVKALVQAPLRHRKT